MGHSDGGTGGGSSMMKSYSGGGMSSAMHGSGGGWSKSVNMDDGNWHHQMSGTATQDRYDRTYNERSGGGYGGSSAGGVMYSGGSRGQDRYGGPVSSRY